MLVQDAEQRLSSARPFAGLRSFAFEDSAYFFGRDEQIYSLYGLLDLSQFIAVIGSSGCGKSSLVKAGLLPLLDTESDGPANRTWKWIVTNPGDAPISRLANAFVQQLLPDDESAGAESDRAIRRERVEKCLRRSSFGLLDALDEFPELGDSSLLFIVDQFEEIFRYAGDPDARAGSLAATDWRDEAANFVQLLLEGTSGRSERIHVLITMRSDFIGDCAQFPDLPNAVSAAQFLTPSLTRDQREEVVRKPLKEAGATIESALVETLLNDVGNDPDQLPVLEHCLLRMWECAGARQPAGASRHLERRHYDDVGRIAGALSQHANEVLSSPQIQGLEFTVQRVFQSLSEVDKDGRATRRAIPFSQLLAETGAAKSDLLRVLNRFRDVDCSFIVPPIAEKICAETRIDVVHEALLRHWDKISAEYRPDLGNGVVRSGWLGEEVSDGRVYRALVAWVEAGSGVTLPPEQVKSRAAWWKKRAATPAWAKRYGGHLPDVQRLFEDSLKRLETDRIREEDIQKREREAAQQRLKQLEHDEEFQRRQLEFEKRRADEDRKRGELLREQLEMEKEVERERAVLERRRADDERRNVELAQGYASKLRSSFLLARGLAVAFFLTILALLGLWKSREEMRAQDRAKLNELVEKAGQLDAKAEKLAAIADSEVLVTRARELRESNKGDARPAALLAAAAYTRYKTAEAEGMLLTELSASRELAHVALPDWAAFVTAVDSGHAIGVLAAPREKNAAQTTGSLIVLGLKPLKVLGHLSNVSARLMCGFPSSPQMAAVSDGSLTIFQLYPQPRIERTIPLSSIRPNVPKQSPSVWISAIGCLPKTVLVATTDGVLSRIDASGEREPPVPFPTGAGNEIDGISVSRSGNFAVLLAGTRPNPSVPVGPVPFRPSSLTAIDLRNSRVLIRRKVKDVGRDCDVYGCSSEMAFSMNEKQLAWYDDGSVHIANIGNPNASDRFDHKLRCPQNLCGFATLAYRGRGTPDAISFRGSGTSTGLQPPALILRFDSHRGEYEEKLAFNAGQVPPLPVYDAYSGLLFSNDHGGAFGQGLGIHSLFGEHSLTENRLPLIHQQPAPNRSGSFALTKSSLILAATSEANGSLRFSPQDVDTYVPAVGGTGPNNADVLLRDAGDEKAVALDLGSGIIHVVDFSKEQPDQQRFNIVTISHAGAEDRYSRENISQIAFDPATKEVTVATRSGIQRYDLENVRSPVLTSWHDLQRGAGLSVEPRGRWLSSRGNYVVLRGDATDKVVTTYDRSGAGAGEVVPISVKVMQITPDEQYLIGRDKDVLALYKFNPIGTKGEIVRELGHLPSAIAASSVRLIAYSPDSRWFAYVDRANHLSIYDAATLIRFWGQLPDPASNSEVEEMTFTADSRFLVVRHKPVNEATSFLAVYAVDPNEWLSATCLTVNKNMTPSEWGAAVSSAAQSIHYIAGCPPSEVAGDGP